ncbi:DUF4397 domain-containing protein [Chitinophaga sp. 22321]|uniref:DUF4397 domain-containing protein n=2 Tax=Chitinophaga hostae TaxID=2831022 RepID=A0ABS5IZC3_9BACT|nr:DUF4397 domain-containing protein [Chitinophaga hostae]MBS0028210.1 DUF4397 domain-containing protein [Chitinophaga hostae]
MKQIRISLKGIAFTLLAGAVFTSCKKKDDPAPPPPPPPSKNATILLVHASPKTGELTSEINGKKHQDKLTFLGSPKAYITVSADKDIALKFSLDGSKVLLDGKYPLVDKGNYSLFLYDTLLNNKIKALLLQDNLSDPGKGKTSVRFLHLSPDAASINIDVFKDKDSLRLISNTAYVGDKPDPKSLSTFKSVAAGDYRVKVKAKDGTKETTILDIPVVKLGEGKVTTLYLSGLTKGTGTTKIGLQVSQHK